MTRSPWVAIGAGIVGLVLGYVIVVGPQAAQADDLARCPCEDGQCGVHAGKS